MSQNHLFRLIQRRINTAVERVGALAQSRAIVVACQLFCHVTALRLDGGIGSISCLPRYDVYGAAVSPLTVDQVLEVLADPRSVPDLRLYFGIDTMPGSPVFSGRRFESLGLESQQPPDCDRFAAADLLAVQCLSVTVPIEIALDLLEGDLGRQIGDLLSRVPVDVPLGTEDARLLVLDGGEADAAWHLLKAQDDVGWVSAGKLLARKRPHLIPVWDNVVRCAFGRPEGAWLWLDDLLRAREGVILRLLGEVHEDAKVPAGVSLLRVLDVVFWMRHRMSHQPSRCPGLSRPTSSGRCRAETSSPFPSQPITGNYEQLPCP
jgi:hypothetical protein